MLARHVLLELKLKLPARCSWPAGGAQRVCTGCREGGYHRRCGLPPGLRQEVDPRHSHHQLLQATSAPCTDFATLNLSYFSVCGSLFRCWHIWTLGYLRHEQGSSVKHRTFAQSDSEASGIPRFPVHFSGQEVCRRKAAVSTCAASQCHEQGSDILLHDLGSEGRAHPVELRGPEQSGAAGVVRHYAGTRL